MRALNVNSNSKKKHEMTKNLFTSIYSITVTAQQMLKGSLITVLSSFTHFFPKLYDILTTVEHKRYFEKCLSVFCTYSVIVFFDDDRIVIFWGKYPFKLCVSLLESLSTCIKNTINPQLQTSVSRGGDLSTQGDSES